MMPAFLALRPVAAAMADESGGGIGSTGRHADVTGVSLQCQEESYWCWAAVTQAVESWAGSSVSQSEIASRHIAPTGGLICATPLGADGGVRCAACDEGCGGCHVLSAILRERHRLAASAQNRAPTFDEIVVAVDANRPLPVRIDWGEASNHAGHFVCVTGYLVGDDGVDRVAVFDPLSPAMRSAVAEPVIISYDDFVGDYQAPSGSGGIVNYSYEVK